MTNIMALFNKLNLFKYYRIKNEKEETQRKNYNEYFLSHDCHVPADRLTSSYEVKCGKLRKCIFELTAVQLGDVRALNMYRSYAALCAEKYRHYKLYPLSIHPFSKLRFVLEIIFSISIMWSTICLAVHYSERDPVNCGGALLPMSSLCDLFNIANIFINFFTGYIEGHSDKYVILGLKKVAYRYAKTWLLFDMLASIKIIFDVLHIHDTTISLVFGFAKILRLPILIKYMNNILTVMNVSMLTRTAIEISVLLISFILWNIYLQFSMEYMIEGSFTPENPRNCSWISIANLWHQDTHMRFIYAMDRAVGMLRKNSNLNLIEEKGCFENFFVVSWIIAKLLVWHCALKYIVAILGEESAQSKYYIMTKQVENYMIQRKFPPRIKKKIHKFYSIRFHSNYFAESRMLACLSGQLREDILMHTGRQFVREVEFLKQLPKPLLMQIAFKLGVVIYIAGDIIFKINTVGDCMYFIDKGTVAIYSESGKEICHLEDGDFFGEIALVMKQRFRTASAVAVTNCELFKLDKVDFDTTIAYYPTVYEDIKKLATTRFERTCVLDEHHKTQIKMANEFME